MKQLLLRIPDDLHARIAERARRSGRSANVIATEVLEHEVADDSGDARAALRAKARHFGVLASTPAAPVGTVTEAPRSNRCAAPVQCWSGS